MKKILIVSKRNSNPEKMGKSLQFVRNNDFDAVSHIRYEEKKLAVVSGTTIRIDLRFVSFLIVSLGLAESTII